MKRFILLCLVLALHSSRLNSCGWDYNSEDHRFWLLQPELAGARPLHAFYFTTEVLNGPDFDEIAQIPFAANIAEWQEVVGNDVPYEAIEQVLYGMDLDYFEKEKEELFRSNAFLVRLAKLKGGWPAYIAYAKRCEQLVNSDDPWGFIAHDGEGIRNAWDDGLKQLRRAKHPLLRARIAFQLVRLAHYAHDPERPDLDVRPIYQKHLAPLRESSWMEPSAAFYLANMLPPRQRDLAFADCFDRTTDKQFRMVQLFDGSGMESYRIYAQNDKQRATLLVMHDLQHPGRALEDLERIAAFDPGNEHLPLLLAREVNKLEDWLLTPDLTDYNAAIRQWSEGEEGVSAEDVMRADMGYLHQVQAFIRRVMPQTRAAARPLLTLLDGHLSYVSGAHTECRNTMAIVEQDAGASPFIRAQARVDRILCGIMATERLSDATRNDILNLVQLVNEAPELANSRDNLLAQLHLYLGKKLMARGEMMEGLFLLARTNRNYGDMVPVYSNKNARHVAFEQATPDVYDSMIAMLGKKDKTPFERYLTATDERPDGWERTEDHFNSSDLTRETLLDYKAMWFLREDSLESAAATYRQVHPDYWQNSGFDLFSTDDPFVVNIEDPHNYNNTDSTHYTRLSIVERMVALKKEAARNPKKRALNNYLLGNAYYNMTWHGKYWGLSRIAWSMHEMSDWRDHDYNTPGDDDYFGCERAEEHYVIAMRAAKDPILKAMACRMAAECNNNMAYYSGETERRIWEDPYREELTDEKSREAFARIEDCSGYADFVRRFR